jgi:hypothetical protein
MRSSSLFTGCLGLFCIICIKCYDFKRPRKTSSHLVSVSKVPFLWRSLFCLFLIQLYWALSRCCIAVATFNVSLLDCLYSQTCSLNFLLWQMLLHEGLQALPICLRCLWLLLLRVLTQCGCAGLLWWGELREECPPRGSLGSSSCCSPLQFSYRMAAASIWRWRRFLSFCYGTIAAGWRGFCNRLFGAFPMQVATTAPQI